MVSHLRAVSVGTPALYRSESGETAATCVTGGPGAEVTFVLWILPPTDLFLIKEVHSLTCGIYFTSMSHWLINIVIY